MHSTENDTSLALPLSVPMYKVACIVMIVQALVIINMVVAITSNMVNGRKLAHLLETWKELQLLVSSHGRETKMQKCKIILSQFFLLFSVPSIAGVFLWLSAYFLKILMMGTEEQAKMIETFGSFMASIDISIIGFWTSDCWCRALGCSK
jgi:hypothetical protein